ncbi:MAG TPA: alanine--tRNA ligase [Candidatus Peribacterales bacterium]|nr:alanine--tRNA ligase [Candidatus Peribacterales bacterium]
MSPSSTSTIRTAYLEYFKSKSHAVIPSASLLPDNDPTTLFTGSGMQPMLPYLLGEKHPLGLRMTDSQKSFRSQDIEEVGDNRHTTFFEMLGNWSLGDYFKAEQIPWMFEFLTKIIKLDPSRIYVTVFRGNDVIPRDDESIVVWKNVFSSIGIESKVIDFAERDGMQGGRIFSYDESKNWWSRMGAPSTMPLGEPGGPDSEMFFDFGVHRKLHESSIWKDRPCHVNCDCGRFLEIGNNVFMEYVKTSTGFQKLSQRNVDFGGGLERIAAALRDDPDVFRIDLFDSLREELEKLSGKTYGVDERDTHAFRVILDHLRGATMLTGDGAPPSNKDQGYFTRRMLRRAIRYAHTLGITDHFCGRCAGAVIAAYGDAYPELAKKKDDIIRVFSLEEEQFQRTLARGEKELKEYLATEGVLSGAKAFYFFETYGFPLELIEELLKEQGKALTDRAGFDSARGVHQEKSREGATGKFAGGLADHSSETTKLHTATHLLNAALRKVLGSHVEQKGSNITQDRLRFDFNHSEKMTPEQIAEVERLVNEAIRADLPVCYHVTTVESAKAERAIGVFDDRYGSEVKVYQIGDGSFSKEICGGPHVARTGMIGSFTIQKEESSSAGIRRIKAVIAGGSAEIAVAGESMTPYHAES